MEPIILLLWLWLLLMLLRVVSHDQAVAATSLGVVAAGPGHTREQRAGDQRAVVAGVGVVVVPGTACTVTRRLGPHQAMA